MNNWINIKDSRLFIPSISSIGKRVEEDGSHQYHYYLDVVCDGYLHSFKFWYEDAVEKEVDRIFDEFR